ncbi:MAG: hypothetical protein V7459_03135 [Oceanicoccus sp.]
MVNFPTTTSPINVTPTPQSPRSRQIVPSRAPGNRDKGPVDRRAFLDRRDRRGATKRVMDRRSGPERRRSSIDLSV